MNPKILEYTKADSIERIEVIQKLWNNYGDLSRVYLNGGEYSTVILKHAKIPSETYHPKGFANNLSQQRKIKSYQVETSWYQDFNSNNLKDKNSLTAKCLGAFQEDGEFFILLEDLDQHGLAERPNQLSMNQLKVVLSWLASFHARHLNVSPKNLWKVGTYWHLETRPDEIEIMEDQDLKTIAPLIDRKLSNCKFQTIVHGDAKLANFCFNKDLSQVAAVDFQYVGGGCGMKDLAYFVGSVFNEEQSKKHESEILEFYFKEFEFFALKYHPQMNIKACVKEWRSLYHLAWADFHRFLKGWSPGHWKINTYSETVSKKVCHDLLLELCEIAKVAALQAGKLIMSYYQNDFQVSKKEGNTEATSIVTEVDLKAQNLIIDHLRHSIQTYDLGLLAEESDEDQSRLKKDFFWAIDPIDGTIYFSEGQPGFAVSIALVSKSGESYIGVVYDPITDELFHAIRNHGSYRNGEHLIPSKKVQDRVIYFADRSLKNSPNYEAIKEKYDVRFESGAVLNSIKAYLCGNGIYYKKPKKEQGGCAIWDIAATSLIIQEAGGKFTDYSGAKLHFNKLSTIYYNEEGLLVTQP